MYRFEKNIDAQTYDTFVESHPMGNLLQTSRWESIKKEWQAIRTGIRNDENELVATALVLVRQIKGLKFGYIARGPVMDYHNKDLVKYCLMALKKLAKEEKWLFIKFDPKIIRRSGYTKELFEQPFIEENLQIVSFLKEQGVKHLGYSTNMSDTIQPRFDAIIDVEQFDESKLHKKVRNCIKAARNRKVEVSSYEKDGAVLLEQVVQKTMERKQISLRDASYFETIKTAYHDRADIAIASLNVKQVKEELAEQLKKTEAGLQEKSLTQRKEKQLQEDYVVLKNRLESMQHLPETEKAIISGGLSVSCGDVLEQIYAGFDIDYKQFYPQYLTYVFIVDYAKKIGCKKVNLGGVENQLDGGLTHYKALFHPIIEEYVGEFDLVISPLYHVVVKAMAIRKWWNKKKKEK